MNLFHGYELNYFPACSQRWRSRGHLTRPQMLVRARGAGSVIHLDLKLAEMGQGAGYEARRAIMAKRIMAMLDSGERDPVELKRLAIAALPQETKTNGATRRPPQTVALCVDHGVRRDKRISKRTGR
jgi:hypothetical protein